MWEALKSAVRSTWEALKLIRALLLFLMIPVMLIVMLIGSYWVDPECERRCAPNGGLSRKETDYNPFGPDGYSCHCEDGATHTVFPWTWFLDELRDIVD